MRSSEQVLDCGKTMIKDEDLAWMYQEEIYGMNLDNLAGSKFISALETLVSPDPAYGPMCHCRDYTVLHTQARESTSSSSVKPFP